MPAEVIELPVPTRSCFNCMNAAVGPMGTYCTLFNEWIVLEAVAAEDCEAYERD